MKLVNCAVFAKLYSPITQIRYILAILDEFTKFSSAKRIYYQTLVKPIFRHLWYVYQGELYSYM